MGEDNDKKRDNPTRKNESKYKAAEINAKYKAVGRSLILNPDPQWEPRMMDMNGGARSCTPTS